jgi:hypothetical protein
VADQAIWMKGIGPLWQDSSLKVEIALRVSIRVLDDIVGPHAASFKGCFQLQNSWNLLCIQKLL